jgi:protein-disulfide isomerase
MRLLTALATMLVVLPATAEDSDESVLQKVLGNADAPHEIIEYASLSCPHCAVFHNEVLPEIKTRFIDTGQVRLVFRDFPLDRPALTGSMLAHCQPDEHFFPVLEQLFAHQNRWATAEAPKDVLKNMFLQFGISADEVDACFADTEANRARLNRILRTRMDGQDRMDVDSTPTFFVNGSKVAGRFDADALAELIE